MFVEIAIFLFFSIVTVFSVFMLYLFIEYIISVIREKELKDSLFFIGIGFFVIIFLIVSALAVGESLGNGGAL